MQELPAGTALGPYHIVAKLGEGGMGAVYRAHDPRLDRDVAIKVSGEQFTERFAREAKAIAALNHTNVCHLYDVGPNYLVMELVEGEPLHGPLPLDQARPLLQQLIDGIEAAHEKGITHRDLKPANIRVTPEGVVKILDFGLAKLTDPTASDAALSQAPTMASPTLVTGAGIILGTAAYMAPEQARGKPADHRADIWAFGAVAYELLTGTRAFVGETVTDILGAVLHTEPDWTQAPAGARPLLQWCLEKDRRKRLQAIGDARRWLDHPADPQAAPLRGVATRPAALLAAASVAAVVTFGVTRVLAPTAPPPQRMQMELSFPEGMRPGERSIPALSPDGRLLAFVATDQAGQSRLWVRSLDASEARPLEGTDGAFGSPFWSPDSRSIVYQDFTQRSVAQLRRIEASGGASRLLCTLPAGQRYLFGGFWTDDGALVIGLGNSPLMKVPAAGGICVPITSLGAEDTHHSYPVLLPDGRRFLYTRVNRELDGGGLYVSELDAAPQEQGDQRVLADAMNTNLVHTLDGRLSLMYVREGTLFVQPFDDAALSPTGEAIPVAQGLSVAAPDFHYRFSAAPTGTLVYQTGGQGATQLTWLDRSGAIGATVGEPGSISGALSLSPDETQVALQRRAEQGEDLWRFDLKRGVSSRVTTNATTNWNPTWAPDSSRMAFSSGQKGLTHSFVRDLSGPSSDAEVNLGSGGVNDWSPDGKVLLFTLQGDLWALPIASPAGVPSPVQLTRTRFTETNATFSPDGKWLSYASDESGRMEVYVHAWTGSGLGTERVQVSNGVASAAGALIRTRWRADAQQMYYVSADRKMMAVDVARGATLEIGVPHTLFDMPLSDNWDVARDGQRFLFLLPVGDDTLPPFRVILNWQAALTAAN